MATTADTHTQAESQTGNDFAFHTHDTTGQVALAGVTLVDAGAAFALMTQPLTDTELRASAVPVSLATLPDTAAGDLAAIALSQAQSPPGADNGAAGIGKTLSTKSYPVYFNGATWDRMRGNLTDGLLVNLGANNDVSLATLPDTAAGDLAAIVAAIEGTLTVGAHNVSNAGTFVVQPDIAATGGATAYSNAGVAAKTQVKGSAARLYSVDCINVTAAAVYLQVFNVLSASVTLGTTVPDLEWAIPTSGDTNGAGLARSFALGVAMGTGITFAITTTRGGATPAAADACTLNMGYA